MKRETPTVRLLPAGEEIEVGTIYCLGRNYAAHAREMNAEVPGNTAVGKGEPIIFLKPPTAILREGKPIRYPSLTKSLHHELELVALLGGGPPGAPADVRVLGYGIGLDMTLRDVQERMKAKGLPWAVAKGFDGSAPVSDFVPAESIPDPVHLEMRLSVNGRLRQHGSTGDMIFTVDEIISYLSGIFTLRPGDLIFTGTPSGVGPVVPGDEIVGEISGIGRVSFRVE